MTKRRQGLVFLVPGFPENEDDTTCLPAIQNYVAAVREAFPHVDTHVVAFQYPFARRTYGWKGVTVHALGGANRRGLLRAGTWARAFLAFTRLRRSSDVRAIHSFWLTECTLVGRWMSRMSRAPHIASIAGQDARADNPYAGRLDLRDATLTAGSSFAADVWKAHTGRRVDRVIPLGLDAEYLQTIPSPGSRDIDVLGVGSLVEVKDYRRFVDIIEQLVPRFPRLRACIVGDGPLRESLQRQIAEKKLDAHVTLAGAVPRDEVFRRMLRSRVFLHPAAYEAQGYVFLEALFAGLPIVCRDVGFTGDSGIVRRCESVAQMAGAVEELLRDRPDYRPAAVPTASDSVRAFAPLYGVGV